MLERRTRSLRILITNNSLGPRSGTSMYVHDLALGLMRRGHNPVAYSPELGDVADMLGAASIPVVDDLRALNVPPDLIHAQHHHEAMTALMRFPDTPAVQVCHGWAPWQEAPVPFPGVMRYVAVDDLCLERLLTTPGIESEWTVVVRNFVDMARFQRVRSLPERPRRALVFSNYAREIDPAISKACAEAGIEELHIAGRPSGHEISDPENRLADYDIVFAKAKAAMEAMASGCAVVLTHGNGVGGLVTTERFEEMRRLNFGMRTMQAAPMSAGAIAEALAAYDAEDAAQVTARLRAGAGLEAAIDAWLGVYADALQRWKRDSRRFCAADTLAAASDYLQANAMRMKEAQHYSGRLHLAELKLRELEAELEDAQRARRVAESELAAARKAAAAARKPASQRGRKQTAR